MILLRFISLALTTLLFASARAADVDDFSLSKGRHYVQVGPNNVIIQTNNAYRFTVIVDNTTPQSVTSVRVLTPNGGGINALADAEGTPYRVRERFDYPFDLENNYPNGNFRLVINTANDGVRDLSIPITGDQYPNAPVLNDYNGAQAVAVNSYKQFSWSPFNGGAASDFIQFAIEDLNNNNVFETPDFGEEGALTGLSTTCIVPPGTLREGRLYVGTLRFVKVLSSGHRLYPGVPGYTGYFTRTEFTVRGVAGPATTASVIDTLQIWKTHRYEYSSAGLLAEDNNPWEISIRGRAEAENMVASGVLTMPSPAGTRPLVIDATRRDFEFEFNQFTAESALHAAYPNGTYTIGLNRVDGQREDRQFQYPPAAFPPAPMLQNISAFNNHRPENPLVISWAPWGGASDLDYIRVEVQDESGTEIFDTPGYTRDDRLRPTATSTILPALSLTPGRTYEAIVTFYKVTTLDFASAPGGIIYGGLATRSKLTFRSASPDLLSAGLRLGSRAWQRSATTFEQDATRPFEFAATTIGSAPGAINSASVTTPPGAVATMQAIGVSNIFTATDSSLGSFGSRFPAGDYRFNVQTARDGPRTLTLNLASATLPPQPLIRNISRLEATTASVANTIAWDPWPGANATTDYVVVTVENASGTLSSISSRPAGDPQALRGTNTQFTIPANNLTANRSYTVRVRFERLIAGGSREYSGVQTATSVFAETSFFLSTITPSSLRIADPALVNNALRFTVAAPVAGRTYRIDSSADLVQWLPGQTYTASTVINIPIQQNARAQFFRLVMLP